MTDVEICPSEQVSLIWKLGIHSIQQGPWIHNKIFCKKMKWQVCHAHPSLVHSFQQRNWASVLSKLFSSCTMAHTIQHVETRTERVISFLQHMLLNCHCYNITLFCKRLYETNKVSWSAILCMILWDQFQPFLFFFKNKIADHDIFYIVNMHHHKMPYNISWKTLLSFRLPSFV